MATRTYVNAQDAHSQVLRNSGRLGNKNDTKPQRKIQKAAGLNMDPGKVLIEIA